MINFGMKTNEGNLAVEKICKKTTNEFKVFDLIIKSGLDQKYPEIIDEYVFFKISQYFEKQTKYH